METYRKNIKSKQSIKIKECSGEMNEWINRQTDGQIGKLNFSFGRPSLGKPVSLVIFIIRLILVLMCAGE